MICSSCGKEIPFTGKICPYCKNDKQGDQLVNIYAQGYGCVFAIVGGIIGNLTGGFLGSLAGGMIALVIGAIVGISEGGKQKKAFQEKAEEEARNAKRAADEESKVALKQTVASAVQVPTATGDEKAMLASGDYKRCPECAEVIRSEAKKCRFCNATLTER